MKTRIIFWGMIFLVGATCNQQKTDSKPKEGDTTTAVKEQPEHEEATLSLNDGKKWKIDEPTRNNINEIKQTFQKYTGEPKPDYLNLATELQGKADKLISECKMTGKDHEMLHVWLEKFLSSLRELKSSEVTIQQAGFHKIEDLLKSFDAYFE